MSRRRAGTYASSLALVQATLQPQPPAPWSSQTTWGSGFMVAPPAALLQLRLYLQARLRLRRSQSMLQPPGEPGWRVAAEEAGTASQSAEPRAPAQGDKVTSWGFSPGSAGGCMRPKQERAPTRSHRLPPLPLWCNPGGPGSTPASEGPPLLTLREAEQWHPASRCSPVAKVREH